MEPYSYFVSVLDYRMKPIGRHLCLALLAMVSIFAPLNAADLEQRVLDLEARILQLEQMLGYVTAPVIEGGSTENYGPPKASRTMVVGALPGQRFTPRYQLVALPDWKLAENWDQITLGMSREEVLDILGSPAYAVRALKPRVDYVMYYSDSARDIKSPSAGKLDFYKDKLKNFNRPKGLGVNNTAE